MSNQVFQQAPQNLYEPVNYVFELGGKRIRPILLLLGNQLFGGELNKALPAAYAVEMFHNFSLLHDDIMDEAPLRRGKPSVHIKYDINTGILSGDVMLIYVYEYLLQCPNALELIRRFNKVAIEVCEGQQYDMDFETSEQVEISSYLKMIELKTAALIGGALELGALIAGGLEKDVEHLKMFGRKIGIAFQLQDDILDTFGDPEKFGKKTGGDISQNKKTYLYLKALETTDDSNKSALLDLYRTSPEDDNLKIQKVKQIFNQLSIREAAEEVMERYYEEAMGHLQKINVESSLKKDLESLAKQLMNRDV